MRFCIPSFGAFVLSLFILSSSARIAPVQKARHQEKHDHITRGKRHIKGPPIAGGHTRHVAVPTTSAAGILTYITPSPGATPIPVTSETQIVTSYIPQFTLCELPPIAIFPISVPSTVSPTAAFQSYSVSIPTDFGTCTTIYEPTITMVCATTLTALDRQYTVTNCNEDITFSTEYGYILGTPTPALPAASGTGEVATTTPGPSITTLTTYYLAPWQQLTAGTAPSEVDMKVCRTFTNSSMECIREYQVWETSLVTSTTTTVTSINISTTIHGASQLIVETFVANVTEILTTFSMSTTMNLEFQTEYITTNSANRSWTSGMMAMSTGPTVYQTRTLQQVSGSSRPSPAVSPGNSGIVPPTGLPSISNVLDANSTTTIHITSTVVAGTRTMTVQSEAASPSVAPADPPSSNAELSYVDFQSMLGAGS